MSAPVVGLLLLLVRAADVVSPPSTPAAPLPLDIVSDTACPAAADIGARLRRLFPEELFGAFPERVHVTRGAGTLKVELARVDGSLVVERSLPASDDCTQLADAVAVVVMTWEGELHPELMGMPPRPVKPEAPPPAGDGRTPDPTPAPVPSPAPATPTVAAVPTPVSATVERFVLVGALGSLVNGDVSAGPRIGGVVAWRGGRLAIQADTWGTGRRTQPLGDGQVRWWRAGVAVGPAVRLESTRWALLGSVQAAVGFNRAAGTGYDVDREESTVLPGAIAGVTVLGRVGAWFGWGGLRALVWPLEPRIQSTFVGGATPAVERALGWFEVDAALGLGIRF